MNTEKIQIAEDKLMKMLVKMPYYEFLDIAEKNISLMNEKINNRLDKDCQKISITDKYILYGNSNFEEKNNLRKKYPEYFQDFHFLELHQKYRYNLKNEHKVPVVINGLDQEIINNHFSNLDLNDLEEFFNEWKHEIINLNHGKPGLPGAIKKEVKKELDEYYKEDENKSKKITQPNFTLNCEYCMLILHSKWVYLLTQKIIETYNNNENYYELNLNENKIRFTITSLVHILIRHYSFISKIAKSYLNIEECSNHNKNVHFEEIHIVLENIFNAIDNSKILKDSYLENLLKTKRDEENFISFQYKETIYKVYFKINKNENESKKIPFNEIATFFPLTKEDEINTLNSNFKKVKLNDEIYLFIENK